VNELHLFAGAGGGILGGILLGHTTVCAVEIEPYCRKVLLQRQRDGILPRFPIWDDIRTFDGGPWRGRVDAVCGGFPCQDISSAGKGAGIEGERSGLWREMARVIREVGPRYAFVENSPMLTSRGLGRVLGDLAEMGYDARWGVLGACDVSAPHKRDRIWILADAQKLQRNGGKNNPRISARKESVSEFGNCSWPKTVAHANQQFQQPEQGREIAKQSGQANLPEQFGRGGCLADAASIGSPRQGQHWFAGDPAEKTEGETDRAFAERIGHIWGVESTLGRVANGVAHRVDRLKAIGNGQVPSVVALAWQTLIDMG